MNSFQDRCESCARMLLAAARESGVYVTGDGRVSEIDAAGLLGLATGSLRNQRYEGNAPPAYRMGICGSRMSYRLTDLAAWLEAKREHY